MNIRKILALVMATVGLLSVILGLSVYGLDTGYKEAKAVYGGDAYTGIQNAAAQAANNIRCATEVVVFVGGSVLLIAGLVLMVMGVKSFLEAWDKPLTNGAAPELSEETAACCECDGNQTVAADACDECGAAPD